MTKDGLRVVTVGTAVTYSITAQNTTATAVDVALTDQLSPVLPAAQVTSSDGGTYDAATGLVTWPRVSVPANGSVTRTVTVDVPDPVEDAVSGDTYSGPSQVSNTANLTTYGVGDSNPLPNNGASSAGVTTNYLFAQVRKTVQNVTPERESAAGTSVQAEPGDTLQYCLNYTNQSAVPLTLTLTDELAPFQTLVPGSFTGGTNTGTGNQVQVKLPDVAAGDSGSVCFRVTIDPL